LPWVGAAFRRVRYDESETELLIMVTPEIAGPMTPEQVPPGGPGFFTDTPTDRELCRDGMIEVPSYGSHCDNNCEIGGLPASRLHYATPCQDGQCLPESAPSGYPVQNGSAGFGTMPAQSGQASPIPYAPPEAAPQAAPMIPESPAPSPAAAPEFPAPPMEDSAIQPTSHTEWYQYNPRKANRAGAKTGSRPGLIEPGK
jgi:pilus assembly protein CpaC